MFNCLKECNVCRNIAGADRPFQLAIGVEAVKPAWRYVVPRIGDKNLLGDGIHSHTIGYVNVLFSAVGDKTVVDHLELARVDNHIGACLVLARDVAPLGTHHIERIAIEPHVVGRTIELLDNAPLAGVVGDDAARRVVVVATRRNPKHATTVALLEVDGDGYLFLFSESLNIDD